MNLNCLPQAKNCPLFRMSDAGTIATSVRLRVRPLRATSSTARSLKLCDGKSVNFRTAEGADSLFGFDAVYGELLLPAPSACSCSLARQP